jgi:hypothetical protein
MERVGREVPGKVPLKEDIPWDEEAGELETWQRMAVFYSQEDHRLALT